MLPFQRADYKFIKATVTDLVHRLPLVSEPCKSGFRVAEMGSYISFLFQRNQCALYRFFRAKIFTRTSKSR